jgi:adenylate cyclase class 2
MQDQEFEVKYYVSDLKTIEQHVRGLGGKIIQPRTHEFNLRYDTPEESLSRTHKVLRLRQDSAAHLTYKGPGVEENGVRVRQEIEFTVSDFSAARRFLEALGFEIVMIYEKYRTTYEIDGTHITLDEMPYGKFIEIEGVDADAVQKINQQLGLNWGARIPVSYTELFAQVNQRMELEIRDLIFENFDQLAIRPEDLGVLAADL